jgi:CheY-like chemotaxis protein
MVLHVEDNHDDRLLFAMAFKSSGLPGGLHQTGSAEEAFEYLRKEVRQGTPPGIVVLDLDLPGSTGREFLARMRAEPLLLQIPVIILSGSDDFEDIQTCRDLYVIDYVVKPSDQQQMSEFIGTFRQWIIGADSQLTRPPRQGE